MLPAITTLPCFNVYEFPSVHVNDPDDEIADGLSSNPLKPIYKPKCLKKEKKKKETSLVCIGFISIFSEEIQLWVALNFFFYDEKWHALHFAVL